MAGAGACLARAERLDDGQFVTHGQRLRIGRTRSRRADRPQRVCAVRPRDGAVRARRAGDVRGGHAGTARRSAPITSGPAAISTACRFLRAASAWASSWAAALTLTGSKSPFQRTVVRWLGIRPLHRRAGCSCAPKAARCWRRSTARVPVYPDVPHRRRHHRARLWLSRHRRRAARRAWSGPGRYMAVGSVGMAAADPPQRPRDQFRKRLVRRCRRGERQRRPSCGRAFGVGAGVRWKSPLGPVQADLA